MFRYVALACITLVALGALVLVGLFLVPRSTPAPVLVAPMGTDSGSVAATVAPAPSYVASAGSGAGTATSGYSCGSADGHAVWIENGTVPCDHARAVASQWVESGTTPGDGAGSAGTMYSWSCTSDSNGDGYCTSKMGSHLRIGA